MRLYCVLLAAFFFLWCFTGVYLKREWIHDQAKTREESRRQRYSITCFWSDPGSHVAVMSDAEEKDAKSEFTAGNMSPGTTEAQGGTPTASSVASPKPAATSATEDEDESEDESEILEESPCGRWQKRREEVITCSSYIHLKGLSGFSFSNVCLSLKPL